MDIFISIGVRLREERERLGYSQTVVAELAEKAGVKGATRQSQALYEKGQRMPDAAFLAVMQVAGYDVTYILTGQRQGQGIGESAVHQAVLDAVDLLSLEKKVDAQQLAKAVVKLAAKSAAPAAAPQPVRQEQVFQKKVGQAVKVEGNLTQPGISFFGESKNKK